MRHVMVFAAVVLLACSAQAAENWFLPYAPDGHTLGLWRLDGKGVEEPDVGRKAPAFRLVGGAAHTIGRLDGGILFDGVKASLNAPPSDVFRLRNDQDFTIEMWVRPDGTEPGMVLSIGTRFYLKLDVGKRGGAFAYRASSFPIRYYPLTDLPITRGQWQHVALTHRRDRTVSLYVNGLLAATLTHSAEGDYAKGGGANVGSHDGWTGYFKGAVDEVRISDCVREYRPLLTERYYLKGENVRLQADSARIPASVSRIHVRVLDRSGRVAFERTLSGVEIGQDLFPVCELPQGEYRVEVTFAAETGNAVAKVMTTLGYAGDLTDRLRERWAAVEKACAAAKGGASAERIESARLLVQSAQERVGQRDFRAAEGRTVAAERITASLTNGEAAYRAAVRRCVRAERGSRDIRVTMSWNGGSDAASAFAWAKRLGANELAASEHDATPEGIGLWKKAGYHTVMLSGTPIHDHEWIKNHPDHCQLGYWVTNSFDAKERGIDVVTPRWTGLRLCTRLDPATHWKMVDLTDGKALPSSDWEFDAAARRVRVRNPIAGHRYQVYFRLETEGMGDPLLPAFAEHGLARLSEELKPYKGVLDTYWFDDLSFAYPGPTPQGPWDWESYTMAARPETVERFARETGIAFDPQWLVMAPRTIDVVPDPSYLAWMQWVQREVKAWLGRAGGVCRELGMSSWLYWGDCHVGMEPYCGSLDETIREIDKPSSDAVTARALADFPGAVKRRLRVDWLFPHVAASDASPDRWLNQWARSRRGLLMRPAEGIYWMPFPGVVAGRDAGVREDVVETLAEIGDEFRLIGDRLAGSSAFTNDLDVYVAHSWGSVYSWRPWGSPILTHLTDLPVRVHFISFAEIEAKGIPADADALMLYGMPNTAWSGGRWWASGKVAAAVTDFVRKGGGLLALQAPSHLDTPQPHWALGDVLGVRAEGPSQRQTTQTDLSQLADTGAEAEKGTQGRAGVRLRLLKAAEGHWMTGGIAEIAGLQETVRVTALPGAKVLCAASGGEGAVPGVVLSEPGKGRVVYLSGWSAEYAFSRLMRRAVFWVARREADCDRLDISGGEDLYVYAFPNERVLVLANNAAAPAKATVRCDPSIFGAKGTLRLVDAATGQTAWEGDAEKLRPGILVETIPRCARLLQLR